MRRRSAARAIALQALYQFDLRGDEFSSQLQNFLRGWARDEETLSYANQLVEGCRLAMPELDHLIREKAENWDLARMPAVDRALLRMATYELLYSPDVPAKVAIDEAIRLAKKYSTEESGRFVNAVLDKIMADQIRGER